MTGAFISGVLLTVFAFFLYGKYKAKRGAGGGSGGVFFKDDTKTDVR